MSCAFRVSNGVLMKKHHVLPPFIPTSGATDGSVFDRRSDEIYAVGNGLGARRKAAKRD